MNGALFEAALVASAVAAGVSSGITFAFSNFIMRALDRLPNAEAVRAMQAINETVLNPLFLLIFMGTGGVMLLLSMVPLVSTQGGANLWLLGGSAAYVLGVVIVTVAGNVPLNDRLARVDSRRPPPDAWTAYARPWTTLNHLRSIAAALASAAFMLAMRVV